MKTKTVVLITLVAIGLVAVAGIAAYHVLASPAAPATWYRLSHGATLAPDDSGVTYLYVPSTMAGVVARIEPTPDDFLSGIRQTDVYYHSDKNGNLCLTYISWDADLGPGDHMKLSVIYKYRVDMDVTDEFEPTVLVGREVLGFQVTKG